LLALDELVKAKKVNAEIVVAHLNHKLRGRASDEDARWVRRLTKRLGYPVVVRASHARKRAARSRDNLEQAARLARYEFLEQTAKASKAKIVLTAHTADDQAETFLLNLMRGSGIDGLIGMYPVRPIDAGGDVVLARPLLSWAKRADTENYCRQSSVEFRIDEMNLDQSFARVRVRQQLLPLMLTFNPRFVETLNRTAEILREDNLALNYAAELLLSSSRPEHRRGTPASSLRTDLLRVASSALRRRALRLWIADLRGDLRRLERAHVLAIEKLLTSPKSGREVELPGGAKIFRKEGLLHYRDGSR
jgi:tRNA(Ile)-lysidine synthase